MSGWPMRYGPRHWAGVPGVRYPEERPVQAEGWLTTAQAAQLLHVSTVRARSALRGAGVAHALAAGGRLLWEPMGALRVAAAQPRVAEALPPGWCTAEEACRLLGCGRATLERRRVRWGLATMRVRLQGRVCMLFGREQVEGAARVRAAAAGVMAELAAAGNEAG